MKHKIFLRSKLFALAVVTICASIIAYNSYAYFTSVDTATNVITAGSIDIDLLEWADEGKTVPFPVDGINNVLPGMEVTKIAEVKNVGSGEAWIRVKIDKSIELAEGVDETADPENIIIDVNDTDWTLGEDGYYYYNSQLQPGETTVPLFTTVHFPTSMKPFYNNCKAVIVVTAYATQVFNNGDYADEAQGWTDEDHT